MRAAVRRVHVLIRSLLFLLLAAGCAVSQNESSPAASSMLRRADAAYQRGDFSEATLLYRSFLSTSPSPEEADEARYRMAASLYRLGRYDDAAKVIDGLKASGPEAVGPAVWALDGDIEAGRGHNVSALLLWERAYAGGSDADRGRLSARIAALVGTMSDEERHQALPLASTEFVRRELESPRRATPVATPTAATAREDATATPTPGEGSARIGLLLPLGGKNRSIGEASLDGARIGVEGDENLAPLDTGGMPGSALRAFESLQGDVGVVAVVGPLRVEEVNAVAPHASAASLSLLPLSQGEAIASPFVFQTAMTRQLQAQTLAAYAVRKLGLKRFAVVHPGDVYGMRFAELFRAAVQSEGARLVGAVAYRPGQTDFTRQIDELQALQTSGGIEAVFVPDSAETVALVAPEIHRSLPQLQLLGSSEWNEGFILAGVANSLEGAIFVDGFYANSSRPATRAFVEKFRRRFGRRPGILEAQAHDAVALVESAISRGAFSRQEIQLMLENLGMFEGASGTLEISEGVVRRQLFVLRYAHGALEELSW